MKSVAVILAVFLLAGTAGAQTEEQGDLQVLEPLLNPDAPLLGLWFCSNPGAASDHTENIQEFIYRKLFDRYDIRLLGRKQMAEKLQTLEPRLNKCNCDNKCLEELGRGLGCDRIIGVDLQTVGESYRLSIKSQIFSKQDTRQLNSVVEGSEQSLLAGALEKALSAIFENEAYHAPLARPQVAAKASGKPPLSVRRVQTPPPAAPAAVSKPPVAQSVAAAKKPSPGFFSRHRWSALAGATALGCLAGALALGVLSERIEDQQGIQYDPGRDATGRDYATAANALFGVSAGAALGAMALFFLVEDSAPAPVSAGPAPGGALVRLTFSW